MSVDSPALTSGGIAPDQYPREGGDVPPLLSCKGAPKPARSMAPLLDDLEAPNGALFS